MVYNNQETFQRQVICRELLRPIAWFNEALRRVGITGVAFHGAGAREEHQELVDGLYQRTVEATNILIDTYNRLVTGIDNFNKGDVLKEMDASKKRLGDFNSIERDIETISQTARLYNFKISPILQIIGLGGIYDSEACLESFFRNE